MPEPRLKKLRDQRIVLTGATSGIGLATARSAASQGAALLLVARNEEALRALRDELRGRGTRADYAVADVADLAQVEAASAKAIEVFGGYDSWVNDAAVTIYGALDDVTLEDQRRLFEVNYWGVVHGTLVASRHLRQRGGAIVNVGSVLSDRAIPYQGSYSASKHAVKGVTDAFRMEFEAAGHPISVSLIKPGSVETPYVEHGRNRLGSPGTINPPPSYHPRVVARAILHACTTPTRSLYVGGGGWLIALLGAHAPRLTDRLMESGAKTMQSTNDPGRSARRDNLYEPREDLAETSSLPGKAPRKTSLLLEAQMNPLGTAGVLIGVGAVIVGAAWGMSRNRRDRGRAALRRARRGGREAESLLHRTERRLASLFDDASDQVRGGGRTVRGRAEDVAHSAADGVRGYADSAASTAREAAGAVRKRGSSLFGRIGGALADLLEGARDRGAHLADDARQRASHLADDAADYAAEAGQRVRRGAGYARDEAAEWAGKARKRAEGYADDAGDRASGFATRAWRDLVSLASDVRERGVDAVRDTRKQSRRWF